MLRKEQTASSQSYSGRLRKGRSGPGVAGGGIGGDGGCGGDGGSDRGGGVVADASSCAITSCRASAAAALGSTPLVTFCVLFWDKFLPFIDVT